MGLADNPWRQGHLISKDCARRLGISCSPADESAVVVVSHDCDIAREEKSEPKVEVIVGRFVQGANGNLTGARSVRTLHLPYNAQLSEKVVELSAHNRIAIDKAKLLQCQPDSSMTLSPASKRVLQQWLASRYMRPAFPTTFNKRLRELKLERPFENILREVVYEMVGVYFDLDDGQDLERNDDSVYVLDIYLVAATEPNPAIAREKCDAAKQKIETLFKEKCGQSSGEWNGIELRTCKVVSKAAVNLDFLDNVRRWNADYLSFRTDTPAPIGP